MKRIFLLLLILFSVFSLASCNFKKGDFDYLNISISCKTEEEKEYLNFAKEAADLWKKSNIEFKYYKTNEKHYSLIRVENSSALNLLKATVYLVFFGDEMVELLNNQVVIENTNIENRTMANDNKDSFCMQISYIMYKGNNSFGVDYVYFQKETYESMTEKVASFKGFGSDGKDLYFMSCLY